MKKNAKREGFTLVELLIVIVVIGVLSAMMMLSSTEAVSSAKAADIISDLRNLKTAALAWYADNLDYVDKKVQKNGKDFAENSFNTDNRSDILKYMNNDSGLDPAYQFKINTADHKWYVYYNNAENTGKKQITDSVAKKLTSRAKSVGLLDNSYAEYNKATAADVYMFIR